MSITQDGVTLAAGKTDGASGLKSGLSDSDQMWERGVFGDFGGVSMQGRWDHR